MYTKSLYVLFYCELYITTLYMYSAYVHCICIFIVYTVYVLFIVYTVYVHRICAVYVYTKRAEYMLCINDQCYT